VGFCKHDGPSDFPRKKKERKKERKSENGISKRKH
jgi:hypothetical protein